MPFGSITPPEDISAVDIDKLKKHLRLVVSDGSEYTIEDDLLTDMITAATEEYQNIHKVALITHTYEWRFKEFKTKLELPRPPTQSISKVEYIDEDGNTTEIDASNYSKVTTLNPEKNTLLRPGPGYVLFNHDYSFPDVQDNEPWPVRVTYNAGYGDAITNVPASVRVYLKNVIGTLYNQRKTILVNYGSTMGYEDLRGLFAPLIAGQPKATRFG